MCYTPIWTGKQNGNDCVIFDGKGKTFFGILHSLGLGEVRAQAIIDYRYQNGPFRNINELTKVEGIGITTYEQIKHLIAVAD